MNETITKFLLFAVGLILTVGLIFMGINIYKRAVKTGQTVSEQQRKQLTAMEESDITRYDALEITGSTAVTYIKRIYDDTSVTVVTQTVAGAKKTFTVDSSQFSDYKNTSSEYYINPLDMYYVEVSRDANDLISGVTITNTAYPH